MPLQIITFILSFYYSNPVFAQSGTTFADKIMDLIWFFIIVGLILGLIIFIERSGKKM